MSSISFMSLRLNVNLIPARRLALFHRFTFYNNAPKKTFLNVIVLVQLVPIAGEKPREHGYHG